MGFMGVNIAAFVRYFVRSEKKTHSGFWSPVAGFIFCLCIWLSLRTPAKIIGAAWLATGFLYGAWKTNWYRKRIEFAETSND